MSKNTVGITIGHIALTTLYLLPSATICWGLWVLGAGINSTTHYVAGLLFCVVNCLSYGLMLIFLHVDKWKIGLLFGSLPIPMCFLIIKIVAKFG
jgi:hypothetical protein